MQDMLASGLAWLTGQLADHAAQTVTYTRDGCSATMRATLGEKLLKLDDGDGGIRMEWTDADFLIPTADMVIAGERIEPRRGDLIAILDAAGTTRTYEVSAPGGEPPWRYSDPHRTMVRIHAKLVEAEEDCW